MTNFEDENTDESSNRVPPFGHEEDPVEDMCMEFRKVTGDDECRCGELRVAYMAGQDAGRVIPNRVPTMQECCMCGQPWETGQMTKAISTWRHHPICPDATRNRVPDTLDPIYVRLLDDGYKDPDAILYDALSDAYKVGKRA